MKTKTLFLTLSAGAFLCFSNGAFAQYKATGNTGSSGTHSSSSNSDDDNPISAGLQVQYSGYFGGSGVKMPGIGVVGEYHTEKFSYRFTFIYDFPWSQTTSIQDYAVGTSGSNFGQVIPVTETDKLSVKVMNLALDVKKIFGDDGGFYLFAGIGLSFVSQSYTPTFSSYDASTYYVNGQNVASSESNSQFYIRFGPGYDLKIGKGTIFAEAAINLAANTVNDQTVDISIPSFYHIAAGYRISF